MSLKRSRWMGWVALSLLLANRLARADDYSVRRWTAEQGLPQNRVTVIRQSRDGYMWFGSWFGLVRFDGREPTVFDHVNTPELENDTISAMEEDPETGTLWIGSDGGLIQYRDRRFKRIGGKAYAPLLGNQLWLAGGDTVWYPSWDPSRLIRVQRGTAQAINTRDVHHWRALIGDRGSGEAWFLAESGIYRIDYASPEVRVVRKGDAPDVGHISTTARDYLGRIWLATDRGLFMTSCRMGETRMVLERVPLPASSIGEAVQVVARGSGGTMWVFANGRGVFHWVEGKLVPVTGDTGLENAQVYTLAEDQEGTVWAGTRTGLVQLRPKHVRVYTVADGLGSDEVWSVQ